MASFGERLEHPGWLAVMLFACAGVGGIEANYGPTPFEIYIQNRVFYLETNAYSLIDELRANISAAKHAAKTKTNSSSPTCIFIAAGDAGSGANTAGNLLLGCELIQELVREKDDRALKAFLRMSYPNFQELLELVEPLIKKQDTNMRQAIPPIERLAITLRYLGSGYESRIATLEATVVTLQNLIDALTPVAGGYSLWGEWACSVTCGPGMETRSRQCDNPAPSGGAADCTGLGAPTETKAYCDVEICPVAGGYSMWGEWACSVTCGSGMETRSRQCDNPAPSGGAADCTGLGAPTETQACGDGGICPGDLRLVNPLGEQTEVGRLEIYFNGAWGTICELNWGFPEAVVACKQLGLTNNNSPNPLSGFGLFVLGLGGATGMIWLNNLDCVGTETRLEDCPNDGVGMTTSCTHQSDVGVICTSEF